MSEVTSKATHWIRQQGYNEENLPGDEYRQMLQAYEAGYREREKEHIEIHSRQERGATRIAELEKENAELKEELKNNENLATVAYMQGAERYKPKWHKPSEKLPEECSLVLAFAFDDSEPALFEFVASDTWEWMPRRIASLSNDQIKCWCEIPKYTEEIKENDSNSSTQNRRNARRGKRC